MNKYSDFLREVIQMTEKLTAWRFLLLWSIGFLIALGYLAGNLPWERLLP